MLFILEVHILSPTQMSAKKKEECCFNEACVILVTLTTHLQLYMKQHGMSRLSLQENGKVELNSAEGRKLAEWIADIHEIIAIYLQL